MGKLYFNSICDGSGCERPTPNKSKPLEPWVVCNVLKMFSKFIKIIFIEYKMTFSRKNGSIKINFYSAVRIGLVDKTSIYSFWAVLNAQLGSRLVWLTKTTPIESSYTLKST